MSHISVPVAAQPWSQRTRLLVSALLVLHLLAVFVGPWQMQPSPWIAQRLGEAFAPYLEVTYLNNGYRFFAPDPPPRSNLIAYEVTTEDGRVIHGLFPHRQHHQPRLLYHRHFMLTDKLPMAPPPWRDAFVQSYAQHLLHVHQGTRITLVGLGRTVRSRLETAQGLPPYRLPEFYEIFSAKQLKSLHALPRYGGEQFTPGVELIHLGTFSGPNAERENSPIPPALEQSLLEPRPSQRPAVEVLP